MSYRNSLNSLLAVCLLMGPIFGQIEDPEAYPIPFGCQPADLTLYKVPWSSPTTSGAFGRTIVGNFDSYGGPDLVIRRGFDASFMPNIATEEGNLNLPIGVTDMATLPNAGVYGGDAIAVVNAAGLKIVSYNPATQSFTNAMLASSWAGVRQVLAVDVDGDGLCDLLGLASDYLSILRLQQTSLGVFTPASAFTLSGTPIRVLRTIEWDGDAAVELALVHQNGWGVWELNGTALNTQSKSFVSGDTVVAIRDPSPTDRLAHCGRPDTVSNIVSLTLLRPGGQVDAPVALGAYRGVTLAAADLRQTGYDDLVANIMAEYKVLRLSNQRSASSPNGPDFLPLVAEVDLVETGGPQPSICMPLASDLDLDGQIDFACAFEGAASSYTLVKLSSFPRPYNECGPQPVLNGPLFRKTEYVDANLVHQLQAGACPTADPLWGSRLYLTTSAHAWGHQYPLVALPGLKIEVVLYRQHVVLGVADFIEPSSLLHLIYTIGASGHVDIVEAGDEDHWNLNIEIPWMESMDATMDHCYFFQLRLLPASGQPGVFATYMGSFAGYSSPPGPVEFTNPYYLTHLASALYGLDSQPMVASALCPPPGFENNQRLGGMAPQTRVPRLQNGYPPQPVAVLPNVIGMIGSTAITGNLATSLPPPPYTGQQ